MKDDLKGKKSGDGRFRIHKDGRIEVQDKDLKKFILSATESAINAEVLQAVISPEVLESAVETMGSVVESGPVILEAKQSVLESGFLESVVEQMHFVAEQGPIG